MRASAAMPDHATNATADSVVARIAALDWTSIAGTLNAYGCAVIGPLLAEEACASLAEGYSTDSLFRSRVIMARHGFGKGEYKYFSYPLPPLVQALRTAAYPHLAPIANQWHERMRNEVRFPVDHATFLERCHRAGQVRPTPLLLE